VWQLREVKLVKSGQLRQWRLNATPHGEESPVFLVLDPYTITRATPPSWSEPGWYILIDGRQQWVAEVDIEDDSEVISEAG